MKFILWKKVGQGKFEEAGVFQSFRGAVINGQKSCGFGKFHVQAPEDNVPTRTEQFLETMKRPGRIFKSEREKKVTDEVAKLRRAIEHSLEREKEDFL